MAYGIEINLYQGQENSETNQYEWDKLHFDSVRDSDNLTNYKIGIKYFNTETNFSGDEPVDDILHPGFELLECSLTVDDPKRFTTEDGDEIIQAELGSYETEDEAIFGFNEKTKYSYTGVFDQSNISYVPRLSPLSQEPIKRTQIPTEPYFPDNNPPIYPIDMLSTYDPDMRDEVSVTYTLKFKMRPVGRIEVEERTIQIIHKMTQNDPTITDWTVDLNEYMNKSYMKKGLIHTALYPLDYPPIYDEFGRLVGEINEPTRMNQLTRKNYPVDPVTFIPISIEEDR